MADHSDGGGGGEVVDRPEDRGGPMGVEIVDQGPAEAVGDIGAEVGEGGDGIQGCEEEAAGGEVSRAVEAEPRAMDQAVVVEPSSEPVDSGMVAEGPPVVEGSSGGISGSTGTRGDNSGSFESPPRDPAKGKGVITEEEQAEKEQATEAATVEIREVNIAFRPPVTAATSSRHVPITLDDVAEHTPNEILAKLLEDNPIIGEYVLKANRARAIEASEAAAWAEREAERERAGPGGLAADVEAEEREAEEAQGPRVSAVIEVGALTRPEFSEETYMPSRPHLFVPSGFVGYRPPQQTNYDVELVLRDPRVHIANTWAEVYFLNNPLLYFNLIFACLEKYHHASRLNHAIMI
ncbi:hypothetical protein RHMOL_Rhmol10G0129100 [Rhododendron molle]|uniref:Uncharacterized protein n=1 Tax=Rhododendron molle TaxID=49168 RepID=A0ACC0M257_RHOML|nr:hypothetical protein RHMOL_Rhmol10G0129100 [Rhododendron molle]